MKTVKAPSGIEEVENIFEELQGEKFKGKIGFLNPDSRGRGLVKTGPPVGLMLLMGVCRDLSIPYGYIDADVYMLSDDEVIAEIKKEKYDYLGLPLVSLRVHRIFPFLERIKKETGTTLIVGGPLPSNDCEWMMRSCKAIDYAVTGEGEGVLPLLLLAIEQNKSIEDIGGVAYWEGEEFKNIPKTKEYIHGSIVPMPDFEQFDFKYYPGASPVGAWPSVNLYANRGCPYNCTFCGNSIWLHKPNAVPVPRVMEWLNIISRKGAKEAYFVDDFLNVNHDWFEELCHAIIKNKFNEKLIFRCLFRADYTDLEQLKLAQKAGFWLMTFGVESGSPKVLKYYKKGETIEHIAQGIEWSRQAGVKSLASFIAGAPIDSVETLLETANFIREINPTYAPINILHPFFGAPITNDVIAKGLLTPEEIRGYDHKDHIIRTETLSTKELVELVNFIKKDFLEFKKSSFYRVKRKQELKSQGLDDKKIKSELDYEINDAQFQDRHVIPKAIMLDKRMDISKITVPDAIFMDTPDIRLSDEGWHEMEKGLRWSRPIFEVPFYLTKEKNILQVSWASMKDGVKIKIIFNDDQSIEYQLKSSGWRTDFIYLPKGLNGMTWVKFQVLNPIKAPNDSRELGIAFKSIRFIADEDSRRDSTEEVKPQIPALTA